MATDPRTRQGIKFSGPCVVIYDALIQHWKMIDMADRLGLPSPSCAVGLCTAVWLNYTKRATNNILEGPLTVLKRQLDTAAGMDGVVDAMAAVGLVRLHERAVEFVDYTETNGSTYRAYCQEMREKARTGGEESAKKRKPEKPSKRQAAASSGRLNRSLEPVASSDRSNYITEKKEEESSLESSSSEEENQYISSERADAGVMLNPHFQTQNFLNFLKQYPRKGRKVYAWQEWCVIFANGEEKPLLDRVLTSLAKWCQSEQWTQEGGKYVPAADRWLADRPWDDDPPAPAPSTASNYHSADAIWQAREARRQAQSQAPTELDESHYSDGDEDAE